MTFPQLKRKKEARKRRIFKMLQAGMTSREVAQELGVCRQRVSQLMPRSLYVKWASEQSASGK